jgi:Flp pilus assembly protein TadB
MRRDDSLAYGDNWRRRLSVDSFVGAVLVVVGLAVAGAGVIPVGSVLVGAGVAYLVLTLRRARRWRRLRAERGLP